MTVRAFSKVSSFPCEIWVPWADDWEDDCVAFGWGSCCLSGISVSASPACCELLTCFL